ncbi:TPA: hypothetical protein ACGOZZ_001549, partial [Streptococcus suis]
LNIFWAMSCRLLYYSLREINDMPAYPWSRTLSYILILSILLVISLWSIPAAMFGLIAFNVIGLIIGRDLEI